MKTIDVSPVDTFSTNVVLPPDLVFELGNPTGIYSNDENSLFPHDIYDVGHIILKRVKRELE